MELSWKKRKAKIICTLGPSTSTYEEIKALALAGMNVARINFSHSNHETHRHLITTVRKVAQELNQSIAVLQDLQGPKIRVGHFKEGSTRLTPGSLFTLTTRDVVGCSSIVSVSYPSFHLDVHRGSKVLLDDGNLMLEVEQVKEQDVQCRVIYGGILKNRKGVNLPDSILTVDCMTEKDKRDLAFGLKIGVDYIAISFVQKPKDIMTVKEAIQQQGQNIPVVAKIERPQAVRAIDEITELADVIMIARGDLGVEMPTEEVPIHQKEIISLCNRKGIPVITATQMLESMMSSPRPTRAEATDVANAILDGSDAVMLSGETAAGQFPLEAVVTMNKIVTLIEQKDGERWQHQKRDRSITYQPSVALGYSACHAADMVQADAIICLTQSGTTAKTVSRFRPSTPILALTNQTQTYNRMALIWGVTAYQGSELSGDIDDVVAELLEKFRSKNIFKKGVRLLFTAGLPFSEKRGTNMLRIEQI